MVDVDVLVAGAGPVGLTAASELCRRGVSCRVVDRLPARLPYAKAVGVQPRTLEIWDRMGMIREALETAVPLKGQLLYVNGEEGPRIDLELPPEVPYGFAALPQYETERLLEELLERWGGRIERETELLSFEQDSGEVRAVLSLPSGATEELTTRYLVGCDGAHSAVRKGLGLSFEGAALPEEYMLGDVEVDWDLPAGYGVRASHVLDGHTDDMMVCIPLPGERRYRISMPTPPELSREARPDPDGVTHGLSGEQGPLPGIAHIQAVLDRLSPRPTTASRLRWSSVFRISHRIVDRYGRGRVFVAGDAAHIHPPTGAQGMNTGIQDAFNLGWKLAAAVRGHAGDGLLESYSAERHPVGEEVVARTLRHARSGIGSDPDDFETIMLREAQLLVGYRGSPLVVPAGPAREGPAPGDRAPDCGGLRYPLAAFPVRLFSLLRGREHTLLLYADDEEQSASSDAVAAAALKAAPGLLNVCAVLAPGLKAPAPRLPAVHDGLGEFRRMYGARGGEAVLVRPDGYIGLRTAPADGPELPDHLARLFGT
ncbi:FAD-dependent monooxygenase [Streptomyces sp. NBC_00059]|uniref:FAD-dependent monooxygenase n=1 Tax=Streptomyces sp. NBC_00059 TaxID=2975635 RepID=UPI0022551AD3|nr:FAD-dependent monooxygenase [Streptomyces sp. NBC_00059]MCX5414383.1 FAD-dependent monooxygenase [Streptomyces sp. NBC_00059]